MLEDDLGREVLGSQRQECAVCGAEESERNRCNVVPALNGFRLPRNVRV